MERGQQISCELLPCILNLLSRVECRAGVLFVLLQKLTVADFIHSATKIYLLLAWRAVSGRDDRCYQQ